MHHTFPIHSFFVPQLPTRLLVLGLGLLPTSPLSVSSLRPARWIGRPGLASFETSILSGWVTPFADSLFILPAFKFFSKTFFHFLLKPVFLPHYFPPYLFSYFRQMCGGSFRNLHLLKCERLRNTTMQCRWESFPHHLFISSHEVSPPNH